MYWTQPVYFAQILTGVAGIGAVLLADNVTPWHILVAAIVVISIVVSLMVVARAEADAERNRSHLETLLRAMELPFFIIKAISMVIGAIAEKRGWQIMEQENLAHGSIYHFQSTEGQIGRIEISAQEFKDLWILDEKSRANKIEARLFGTSQCTASQAADENICDVIRNAMSKYVRDPHWITLSPKDDGTRVYELKLGHNARPINVVTFSKGRLDELLLMLPIRRYHELADEVDRAFSATSEQDANAT